MGQIGLPFFVKTNLGLHVNLMPLISEVAKMGLKIEQIGSADLTYGNLEMVWTILQASFPSYEATSVGTLGKTKPRQCFNYVITQWFPI